MSARAGDVSAGVGAVLNELGRDVATATRELLAHQLDAVRRWQESAPKDTPVAALFARHLAPVLVLPTTTEVEVPLEARRQTSFSIGLTAGFGPIDPQVDTGLAALARAEQDFDLLRYTRSVGERRGLTLQFRIERRVVLAER